eukprot:TRINITY_DN121283_c0_g1_i1.p1 TRINITY_DN121283_c0_g1~~TRINITY_DN121283_c0_g1_i1.p1  ORF type:complete len:434 (+),score=39.35 TRINITY_DN121283_c0_g1_i1:84-1385(+)
MAAADKSATKWLEEYYNDKQSMPTEVTHLDSYIRNRGGKVRYSELRAAFQQSSRPAEVARLSQGARDVSSPTRSDPQGLQLSTGYAGGGQCGLSPSPLLNDVEQCIKAIKEGKAGDLIDLLRRIPHDLQCNQEIAAAFLRRCPQLIQSLPDALLSCRDFMLTMVRENGSRLQYTSEALRSDHELVGEAVRSCGSALQHASPELRADRDIVMAAMEDRRDNNRGETFALRYASDELRHDMSLVLRALKLDPSIIRCNWFPIDIKANREFMLTIMHENCTWFQFAAPALKADHDIALAAVSKDPFLLRFADPALKKDYELVLAAMRVNNDALRYADKELRDNKEELMRLLTMRPMLQLEATLSDCGTVVTVTACGVDGSQAAAVTVAVESTCKEFRKELGEAASEDLTETPILLPHGELLVDTDNDRSVADVFGL